jgi:ribonuclease P protein component
MERAARLRRRTDFDRVLHNGRRVTARDFVLYHARRDGSGSARVGFSVPRRIGGAVVRNRTRRRLREAVRRLLPALVTCDVVVAARPEIATSGLDELESGLRDAAGRAGLIRSDAQGGAGQPPVKGTSI